MTEQEVESWKQVNLLGGSNQSQLIKLQTIEFQSVR